jgi:hypothetical protein
MLNLFQHLPGEPQTAWLSLKGSAWEREDAETSSA